MTIGDARYKAAECGFHLIETGPSEKPAECQLIVPGDFTVDEKAKQAHLTEEGHERVERLLVKAVVLSPGESL